MTYIPFTEREPTRVKAGSSGAKTFKFQAFVVLDIPSSDIVAVAYGFSQDEADERAKVLADAINTIETETYVKWLRSLEKPKTHIDPNYHSHYASIDSALPSYSHSHGPTKVHG